MKDPDQVWVSLVVEPSPQFIWRIDNQMRLLGYSPEGGGWESDGKTWQQVYNRKWRPYDND